jgi:VIT1/CCC1 family predicted Fe2+/Mn2+ transporter
LPLLVAVTIVALAILGMAGARAGGARILPAAVRVVVWGSMAMAITFAAGRLFHATI